MTTQTKVYISAVIATGFAVLAGGLFTWQSSGLERYLTYFLLAMIASTLKVRLPGIRGNYSLAFLIVLIGIADLSFSEIVTMGCCSAIVQCAWRSKRRPRLVQFCFNVAAIAITVGTCYGISHAVPEWQSVAYRPIMAALVTAIYFPLNTAVVSGVISLFEKQQFASVWHHWLVWSFPYYLVGAAIAGVVEIYNPVVGWRMALVCLTAGCLMHLYYRSHVPAALSQAISHSSST